MQAIALKRAGCSVFVKRRDDLDRVCGRWNQVSLERLFSNLIQNVVRHAPGVPIEVSFARRDDQLQIHFADGGPGLPLESGAAPASPSPPPRRARTATASGSGSSTAIVAEMGGEITMQSRARARVSPSTSGLPSGKCQRRRGRRRRAEDDSGGDQAVECGQP